MLKKQKEMTEEAVDNLRDILDHPWRTKWPVVDKLRKARSNINLTLKHIRKEGIGR